jgi:dolichyl-phosphate-mannose--protein O-mannosyl transferase
VTGPTSLTPSFPRHWTRLDTLLVTVLTALAGVLRFHGITKLRDLVFDEFYA